MSGKKSVFLLFFSFIRSFSAFFFSNQTVHRESGVFKLRFRVF